MNRFRLLQNHPYAEKGTIVTVTHRTEAFIVCEIKVCHEFTIPVAVEHLWLEEVKEVTCSKEFAEALRSEQAATYIDARTGEKKVNICLVQPYICVSEKWLDSHTSTEK